MCRKKKSVRIGVFLLLLLIFCSGSGCSRLEDTGISYIDASTDVSTLSDDTINTIVENVVNSMTLDEKIGQMFIVDVPQLESSLKSVTSKKLSKKMKKKLDLYPVGGVVLFSREIRSPKQTKRFLNNLQKDCDISLFTCVDEEGGSVSRIASNPKMKTTVFPDMYTIGLSQDKSAAKKVGTTIGAEISKLGFNVDFAPVADVLDSTIKTEENQTMAAGSSAVLAGEIGSRSFGSDANVAADMVLEVVKGLKEQKVCATLKHFPGQGAASSDTHISAANVSKSINELRKSDFVPFSKGIKAGADFVMVSHESLNSLTGDNTPACMSSLVIKDILREELGFHGIVITDAMNMQSITGQYSSKDAAVNCVKAGVDVILMPGDLEEAYNGLIDAVNSGEISKGRINSSVKRIIKCKIKHKILPLASDVVIDASQADYENYQDIEYNNR